MGMTTCAAMGIAIQNISLMSPASAIGPVMAAPSSPAEK